MRVKFCLVYLLLMSVHFVQGQILAPLDPYKSDLGFQYFSIDFDKDLIVKHKIKSIAVYCTERKSNGTFKGKAKLAKKISFDEQGNLLTMDIFTHSDYRWIYRLSKNFEKNEYRLFYDSLNRLIRTNSVSFKNKKKTFESKFFYYYNIFGERESEKGTSIYINDKNNNLTDTLFYSSQFKKDTILATKEPIIICEMQYHDDFSIDTIFPNRIRPQITKSDSVIKVIHDSLGKVIEKWLCVPPTKWVGDFRIPENLITSKIHMEYDKNGNMKYQKLFNSSGLLIETIEYTYNNEGLLLFVKQVYPESRKGMKNKKWIYSYEFHK